MGPAYHKTPGFVTQFSVAGAKKRPGGAGAPGKTGTGGGGVAEVGLRPVGDEVRVEGAGGPAQGDIQVTIISALPGGLAGHLSLVFRRLGEDPLEEGDGAGEVQLPPVEEEVEAGLAAHGAEVEDGVLLRGVPEEGGDEVLHGVHLGVGQKIAGVGLFEAEIQGDGVAVPPGEVEAGGQHRVVHGEAGDAFHVSPPLQDAGRRAGPPGPGPPGPRRSRSTPPPAAPRRGGRRRISGPRSGCRSAGRPGRWRRPPSP